MASAVALRAGRLRRGECRSRRRAASIGALARPHRNVKRHFRPVAPRAVAAPPSSPPPGGKRHHLLTWHRWRRGSEHRVPDSYWLLYLMQTARLRRGERLDFPRRPTNHHLVDGCAFPHTEMHATLILRPKAAATATSCTCSCPFHHNRNAGAGSRRLRKLENEMRAASGGSEANRPPWLSATAAAIASP